MAESSVRDWALWIRRQDFAIAIVRGSQLASCQVFDLVTERLSQIIGDAEQAGLDTAPTG